MKDPYKGTPFWQPQPEERVALRGHLLAELPLGHVLDLHKETLAVDARDRDGDRLIVTYGDGGWAVVQMSWAGRPAMAPFLPETETFASQAALLGAASEAETP